MSFVGAVLVLKVISVKIRRLLEKRPRKKKSSSPLCCTRACGSRAYGAHIGRVDERQVNVMRSHHPHVPLARIVQEQEAARDRASQSRDWAQPQSALPRKLQACMQELLNVNERYHELLSAYEVQRSELDAAKAELAQLRPALEDAHAHIAAQEEALQRAEATAVDLTQAHELQGARCMAAEAERDDLHKVVKAYAQRLLDSEQKLDATIQKTAGWEAGYEEGVKQQQREAKGRMLRARQQAQSTAQAAFERGKKESAAQQAARITREQAERRLLLHRAEGARQQQQALARKLEAERQARVEAQTREQALEARLKGVRSQKQSLNGELNASRAAHAADLQHFDSMENALGVACAEYSSLAARHARSISPPPTRAGASAEENERTFGSSPPEAMRTCTPRPAQTS